MSFLSMAHSLARKSCRTAHLWVTVSFKKAKSFVAVGKVSLKSSVFRVTAADCADCEIAGNWKPCQLWEIDHGILLLSDHVFDMLSNVLLNVGLHLASQNRGKGMNEKACSLKLALPHQADPT